MKWLPSIALNLVIMFHPFPVFKWYNEDGTYDLFNSNKAVCLLLIFAILIQILALVWDKFSNWQLEYEEQKNFLNDHP